MKHQPLFDLVSQIIEDICEYKGDLRIFSPHENGAHVLLVIPHTADYPKLIGKGGRQVNAMKFLFRQASLKLGCALDYQIKDSFTGTREAVIPFAYNPDFDAGKLERMMEQLAALVMHTEPPVGTVLEGDRVIARIKVDRTANNEAIVAALDAVFYAWCYPRGRKLKLIADYITHETNKDSHQPR